MGDGGGRLILACPRTPASGAIRFALAALVFVVAILTPMVPGHPPPMRGATISWTGLGATANWNLGANWSAGVPPGAADIAVFDGTGSNAVLVNANINVAGIQVTPSYLGSITQGATRTITVGASGWSQVGSTFIGSDAAITVNGPFSLSGGTFTSTSGILAVSGGFTVGGGTFDHHAGTLRFTGGAAAINVPGAMTVWDLGLAQANGVAKTLDAGDVLVVAGTLTLTNGTWEGGELRARGPIVATSGFDGGDGTLRVDGAADQLFTGTATVSAGELPNLVIDKPTGTLSLAGTIRVATGGWTYLAGTLDPGSSTVSFDSGSLIAGSHTLASVVLRGSGAKTLPTDEVLTVGGLLTLTDGTWDGGTLLAAGDVSQASTFDGGNGTLRIGGVGSQLFSGSANSTTGQLPIIVIDKPSGTLALSGTIRTLRDWTYVSGGLDAGASTVVLGGALTVSGSHSLGGVELRGANPKVIALGTTLVVDGLLTLTDGTLTGETLAARGPIVATSGFDGGDGTLRVDGAADQLFTGTATVSAGELPNLVIDKPTGTLSLAGTIRVATGGWTYLAGTLDPGSSTVSFDSGSLIAGSHTLASVVLRGSGAKTLPTDEVLTVGGLLTLTDGTWDGGTLLAAGDVSQASTFDGGNGTLRIGGVGSQLFSGSANSTTGQLPIIVIDKPSGTLALSGTIRTLRDWTYVSGGLDAGASTVVLGGALTVSGSHSLGGVELRGANPKVIALGTTLVVDGLLTLTDGTLTGETLAARGPIVATSGFDGGDGTLRVDGAADQLFTGTATVSAGELPNLVIDKPTGTLSLAGTIRVATGGWTYLAGTLDPGSSTVSFDSGSLIAGSHTLASVVLRGSGAKTLPTDEVLTVGGLLTLTDGTWDGGTLLAAGDVSQASTFDGGNGTLRIGGVGSQLFSGSANSTTGQLPIIVIDKPSGTLALSGTIRTLRDWTYVSGGLDAGASTVVLGGALTLSTEGATLNSLQIRGGTATLGSQLVLDGNLVVTSGTFDLAAHAVDVEGSISVAGTLVASGADVHVAGDVLVTGVLVADGSVITLDGAAPQHLDTNASILGDLVIDGPGGTTLDRSLHVRGSLQLASGTLTLGPHGLTIEHPLQGMTSLLIADATSTLTVSGTAPGIVVPSAVADLAELSIQTPQTVALEGPLNLHVHLDLDGGNLDAGDFLVRMMSVATVSRTSGHVIGTLEKPIPAGGPFTASFEIGDFVGYTPLVARWTAVTVDGTLAVSTSGADDPVALAEVGLIPSASVNRTWTTTPAFLGADPVEIEANYLPGDLDPAADPQSLLGAIAADGTTTLPTVVQRTATSVTVGLDAVPGGTLGLAMAGSDFGVTIDGAGGAVIGEPSSALVVATNHGVFDGTGAVAISLDGATVISAAASQGACTPSGSSVVCMLGPVASGGVVTIHLVVSFGTVGTHRLFAAVTAGTTTVDINETNDSATLDVLVSTRGGAASPTPTSSAAPSVSPGGAPQLPNTAGSQSDPGLGRHAALIALLVVVFVAWMRVRFDRAGR